VDLTIIPLPAAAQPAFDPQAPLRSCEAFQSQRFADNSLDMGTGYDCFSPLSATDHPDIGLRSHSSRQLLKTLMAQQGFVNLPQEWWHYTLTDEPYPTTWFDFPIE
jgi:D-alanyl-D-alanine dipeptidase